MAWLNARPPCQFLIDNSAVVLGLLRGCAYCCAPGRPYAHVWQLVWSKLDDASLVPGVNLDIVKVKAHISKAARGTLDQPQAWQLQVNDVADKWAKAGAYGAEPPGWATAFVFEKLRLPKRALEYIAHFRVAPGKLGTTSLEREKRDRKKAPAARIAKAPQGQTCKAGPRHFDAPCACPHGKGPRSQSFCVQQVWQGGSHPRWEDLLSGHRVRWQPCRQTKCRPYGFLFDLRCVHDVSMERTAAGCPSSPASV